MVRKLCFFHRNKRAGYSIDKVTRTIVSGIDDKEEYYVPYADASLKSCIGNMIYVFKHRDKNAINHITGDIHYCIMALIGCDSVLTVHDAVLMDFHKYPFVKREIIKLFWYIIPLRLATRVVCVSEETRKSLSRFTGRRDIVVIHNAVGENFTYVHGAEISSPAKILHIGTTPNKNLIRTIEALRGLDICLTIIGVVDSAVRDCVERNHILCVCKSALTDDEIIEEYVNCDIVSFLSLYEGFGMPIIEANAIGRPVICSDIPVFKEVGADAVYYVDPFDIEKIKQGFISLCSNASLRKNLVLSGRKNSVRFRRSEIQKKWAEFYLSI